MLSNNKLWRKTVLICISNSFSVPKASSWMNKWHHEVLLGWNWKLHSKVWKKKYIPSVQQRGEVLIKKIQVKLFRVNYMCIHSATHGCHVKVTCQFDTHGCHVTITYMCQCHFKFIYIFSIVYLLFYSYNYYKELVF